MIFNGLKNFDSDLNDFKDLAIAIKMTDKETQQCHLGIFLKNELMEQPKMLHLGWHNDFRFELVQGRNYFFLDTCKGINKEIIEDFVDWLATLWEINGSNIPYGLVMDHSKNYISSDTAIIKTEIGQGFTCATFVMQCFKAWGFEFLDTSSWPIREEDIKWKDRVFWLLEKEEGIDMKHIEIQRKDTTIIRFRPEEVAAAANMNDFSSELLLNYEEVEPSGKELVRCLTGM